MCTIFSIYLENTKKVLSTKAQELRCYPSANAQTNEMQFHYASAQFYLINTITGRFTVVAKILKNTKEKREKTCSGNALFTAV